MMKGLELDGVSNNVWMPIADFARERGITRQSMSERVAKLEEAGKLTTRKKGRNRLVNVPEFDLAVEEEGDAFAEQRADTRSSSEATDHPELRNSQAKKAAYDAEMARLKLEREQGKYRSVEEIEHAAEEVALIVIRALDKLISSAPEIHKQKTRKDIRATRAQLKKMSDGVRKEICDALNIKLEKHGESKNGES